jgi:hypothetical protein
VKSSKGWRRAQWTRTAVLSLLLASVAYAGIFLDSDVKYELAWNTVEGQMPPAIPLVPADALEHESR